MKAEFARQSLKNMAKAAPLKSMDSLTGIDARMEALYREHILKEPKPQGGFVPLGAIAPIAPKASKEEKEEVFGD